MSTDIINRKKLHSSFRFNKKEFTEVTLTTYAESLIKQGELYEVAIGRFFLKWLDNSRYITVYTSGSTGEPKAIKIDKKHMINSAKATGKFFNTLEGANVLLCLSADYIAGKMMLVRAMVLGWKLDAIPPQSNPLTMVLKYYDFCAMVPMQLENSIEYLHLVKKMIVGGGAISEHLANLVREAKTKVYETYGMTETVSHIAVRRINSKKRTFEESYFKALPQIGLSVDYRNCLVIKALSVAKEEVTTNDVIELFSNKKFRWKGRIDNIINSGGVKLNPEEIERKLQVVIRNRFIVSWIPNNSLGQQLVILVEDPLKKLTILGIEDKIKLLDSLKRYEIPKKVFILEKFKETATGKIHRERNRLNIVY